MSGQTAENQTTENQRSENTASLGDEALQALRARFHGVRALGIDAGGTGLRTAWIAGGRLETAEVEHGFNFLLDDGASERFAAQIRAHDATTVGIAVPGLARVPGAAAALADELRTLTGAEVIVESDAVAAWLGAFLGAPGIAVIAGTGAVALGGSRDHLQRAGGYGYLIGDAGGGYWIGRQALAAALAGVDGSGPATALSAAIAESWGCSLDDAVVRVHQRPTDRTLLAGLAPLVATGAESGDGVCVEILDRGGDELAALAAAVRSRVGDLPVAGVGGIFQIARLKAAFCTRTGAREPLAPPPVGALLLAGARP